MKFFSKRNKGLYRNIGRPGHYYARREISARDGDIVSDELRNRISSEINFIISRDDFLEWFILFENQKKEKIYLNPDKVNEFSLAELGYKMSDYFNFDGFSIKKIEYIDPDVTKKNNTNTKSEDPEDAILYFDDPKTFDLIEFIILFSKKSKRDEITKRFNDIFNEEESPFEIINGTIRKKEGEDLDVLSSLLKDTNLKQKLEDFQYYQEREDYINTSKISAEILNIIFSDFIVENKKKEIDKIIDTIIDKLVIPQGDAESKKKQLSQYLNDILVNLKGLNNNIYDIRHTEKSTTQTKDNYIYKLISSHNISFAELVLSSLKEEFIFTEDWEKIKNEYINKYQIDKNLRDIIEKPKKATDDVDIKNIPF